jgi:ribonuclease BN (tRNA processing enzyme)
MVYRIEWGSRAIVYATDTEGYVDSDRRLANFARGADLLIHDAQYAEEHYQGQIAGLPATQGWGHSTARMAAELACMASVQQLILFHHDPNYTDEQITAIQDKTRQVFSNTLAAYEGLVIQLQALAAAEHPISTSLGQAAHQPALAASGS